MKKKDEKVNGSCSTSFSDECCIDSMFWVRWGKETTTSNSGEEKSDIKYARNKY